ncbi:hypothetical protein Ancab_031303 [Ancistrocladus abbreviatus]
MDDLSHSHAHASRFLLLIVLSLFCLQSRAGTASSVLFLDSPTHQYLRSHPANDINGGSASMSAMEVGAAVSVLLGFVPPATLSADSSYKLNRILMPNPFDRPRNVFMLQVGLSEDFPIMDDNDGTFFGKTIKNKVVWGSDNVQIEIPDEGEIAIFSLDGSDADSNADITIREINEFASWLGGIYAGNDEESLNGNLTISLPSGLKMNLQMSKKIDKEFVKNLISLVHKFWRAMEMHQDMFGSTRNVSKLLSGHFHGFKALQEEYGSKSLVQQAKELFLTTLSRIFDSLQARQKGEIVGVILFSQAHIAVPEKVLDVTFTSQLSPRWLEEAETSYNSTVTAEVALVRRILAWITGIILLISTVTGIYLLMNMPLTRDTLLYSNVKLD